MKLLRDLLIRSYLPNFGTRVAVFETAIYIINDNLNQYAEDFPNINTVDDDRYAHTNVYVSRKRMKYGKLRKRGKVKSILNYSRDKYDRVEQAKALSKPASNILYE